MEENRKTRLRALASLAKMDQESDKPHVSQDGDYFDEIRKKRGERVKESRESSEKSYSEMLENKEKIESSADDLSREEKEKIAKDTLSRKKREAGIQDKEVSENAIKDMFKLMK